MSLPTRLQRPHVARRLREAGLSEETVPDLASRFERATAALPTKGTEPDALCAFFVPGRIEVLGKHTDYAGGRSLTCATERGFCLAALPSPAPVLHVHRVPTGETVELDLTPGETPPEDHWAHYPMAVVRRVRQNFDVELRGGHVAFSSSLPQAAGMSSSSALVVAFFEVLSALNDLPAHPTYQTHLCRPEARAQYLGAVERGTPFGPLAGDAGVGTAGGSQDHTAILCSAPGRLRQFRYRPTRREAEVPCPDGHVFVIADSGVVAEKTGAAQARYNRASRLAERAAETWRTATGREDPHLGAAVASEGFSPDRMREALRTAAKPRETDALLRRVEHFYREHCQILPAAVAALREDDLATFGEQGDRSQRAAETLLRNQVPETIFLARMARALGATAASAFGAGFGGSVWALVPEAETDSFRAAWAARYARAFPEASQRASVFVERPGPAAFQL